VVKKGMMRERKNIIRSTVSAEIRVKAATENAWYHLQEALPVCCVAQVFAIRTT